MGPNLSKYKTCKYISFERSFTSGTEMFLKCLKMAFNGKTGKVDCLSFLGVSPGSRTCSAADAHVDWMQWFFLRLCQTWLCKILTQTCILHYAIYIQLFWLFRPLTRVFRNIVKNFNNSDVDSRSPQYWPATFCNQHPQFPLCPLWPIYPLN